jgi:hypothetical protein
MWEDMFSVMIVDFEHSSLKVELLNEWSACESRDSRIAYLPAPQPA